MRALLDTNIILLHLTDNILASVSPEADLYVSAITLAESLRFPGLSDTEIHALRETVHTMTVLSVDERIAFLAGELGRTRRTRLPDLLIAATALEHDLILISQDLRDFKNIPGLTVRNKF